MIRPGYAAQFPSETIVLSAGKINLSQLPVNSNQSNGMILVNSKPVIGWILDDLLEKKLNSARVVVRRGDAPLIQFLQRTYSNRMRLDVIAVKSPPTILHSLQAALARLPASTRVARVTLGDTLIRDAFEGRQDFAYVGMVDDSSRWCVAMTDSEGKILSYWDKVHLPGPSFQALAGYYHFTDTKLLKKSVRASLRARESQLAAVLARYGARRPLLAKSTSKWFDFGHIDRLVESRLRLLPSRFFNTLRVDPLLNTITKISDNEDKLANELAWYNRLPAPLRILTPRITRRGRRGGKLEIEMEYYGYPALAGLFVHGKLDTDMWQTILRHILKIHARFCEYPGRLSRQALRGMYDEKVRDRLNTLAAQSAEWHSLLHAKTVRYNNITLRGLPQLDGLISEAAIRLAESASVRVVHGDLCFSNILFDVHNVVARLIDPRGSFGVIGIFGDPRYDVAKLRHSVCGFYDLILADLFELKSGPGGFHATVLADSVQQAVGKYFDDMIVAMGYSVRDIKLIEGLLFISMAPLHRDTPQRQKMMFLTGLSRLNETLP